jgi:carboxypeptidase D
MFLQFRQVLVSLVLATLTLTLQANGFTARIDKTPGLKGKRYFIEEDGIKRTVFEHEDTGATIDFVTNSGICETTPGVNQYSGYISVGSKPGPIPSSYT